MSDFTRNIFKERLNDLFIKKGSTQKDLAEYMGVHPSTINEWLKGRKVPRLDKIDKLCSYFLCSRKDLLESESSSKMVTLNDHDKNMVEAYHRASDDDKQIVDITLKKYLPQNARPQIEDVS